MKPDALLRQKLASVWPMLDERTRRLVAGDPEMITRRERLEAGVPIPDDLMEQLRGVASRANVPFVLA